MNANNNGTQSGNRFKKMVYNYDLISGKVNQVSYEPGQWDAYYHLYSYDAENRLTNVISGRDSVLLFIFPEQEAKYSYYKHGPLAQTILGQLQVQKQDYAYTLQVWLKAINPTMGGALTNGTDTTEAKPIAQDVYGFSLHYFNKDYRAIGYTPQSISVLGALTTNAAPLYNVNIAAMAVNIPQLSATKVYNYHYDQLNRIVAMDMFNGLNPNTGTFTPASDTSYKERISYDPNGNILGYLRNGDAGNTMDSLNYKYYANKNQLSQVTDNVLATKYNTDIDNQASNNYTYDAIGNLVSDASDTITNITWNVYGKILNVTKNGRVVRYVYDASGNRIMKQTNTDTTVYVRDATGNVLSVYVKPVGDTLAQKEKHLYGSSRLGMATQHLAPDTAINLATGWGSGTKSIFTRGEKLFELSNHLGNVLVTVTDRRIQGSINNDTVNYYKADIASANDYYPFGMVMPARSFIPGNDYRYGFNGKEKDKNISSLTAYDYGFRIYNPAIGKFLSVDPLYKQYPMLTPYQFSSNSPIANSDLDGRESKYYNITLTEDYDASGKLIKTTKTVEYNKAKEAGWHVHGIVPSYTSSGNLGEGTLYAVYKVKRQDKKDGEGMQVQEISKIGSIYTPPPPKVTKEHPASSFNFGIQVFGSGYDPDEAPTSKANSDMKVISFNFKEFQEIMEPVLIGVDAKVPRDLLPPKLDDLIEQVGDETIDQAIKKLDKKWEDYERKKEASEQKFIKCASCNGIKRVGEPDDSIFYDKDTTKKGATYRNTTVIPLDSFH